MHELREKLFQAKSKNSDISGKCTDGRIFFFYARAFSITDKSILGMGKEVLIDSIVELNEFPNQ